MSLPCGLFRSVTSVLSCVAHAKISCVWMSTCKVVANARGVARSLIPAAKATGPCTLRWRSRRRRVFAADESLGKAMLLALIMRSDRSRRNGNRRQATGRLYIAKEPVLLWAMRRIRLGTTVLCATKHAIFTQTNTPRQQMWLRLARETTTQRPVSNPDMRHRITRLPTSRSTLVATNRATVRTNQEVDTGM